MAYEIKVRGKGGALNYQISKKAISIRAIFSDDFGGIDLSVQPSFELGKEIHEKCLFVNRNQISSKERKVVLIKNDFHMQI